MAYQLSCLLERTAHLIRRFDIPRFFKAFSFSLSMLLLALNVGCSTVRVDELHANTSQSTTIPQQYYHVKIPSFDGTLLKATVFQPELSPYQEAPLILHAHGWGTWRMKGTMGLHASFMVHGKAGIQAWKKGYWVVSFDQRGFGGSGGKVNLMDPDIEVKDAMAVIDWAVDNLPRLAFDDEAKSDPKIGMLGESYGGQLQLFASVEDPRIDAIVPMTTWHDLGSAIAPDGHLKSFWATIFFGFGSLTSGFDLDSSLYQKKYLKSVFGKMTPETKELLYKRSMASYCDQGQYPQADTLFIQGFRDTVFPINHAIKNMECAKKGVNYRSKEENDIRLLVMQGGHLLPTQRLTGLPIYNTEKVIHCEDKKLDLTEVMVDWFDAKLLGQSEKIQNVPNLCMTQDYKSGIIVENFPVGGEEIEIEKHAIRPGVAGMFEFVARPMDWITSLPKGLLGRDKLLMEIEEESRSKGGFIRPAFVPLKVADRTGVVTGIPTAELYVDSENEDVTLFTALGIKKPNSNRITILSEQLQPLTGRGYHSTDFPGMSSRLERGDVLGLVVYGANSQYFLNRTFSVAKTEISGKVDLPLLRKSGEQYVAYSSPDSVINNIASSDLSVGEEGLNPVNDLRPFSSDGPIMDLLE